MALRHSAATVTTTPRAQCGTLSIHLGFSFSILQSMSTGKKRSVEELWRDLFLNTSEWWDHRPEKINPRFPDFKHKETQESLWLVDTRNPSWVQAELAAIPPATFKCNVFAWAQRIKRHVKAGQYIEAMEVFHQMQQEGICPNAWTFLPVLNACAGLGALEEGKHVHKQIIQVGCESNVYVATCLVDMYTKCGSIEDAWCMFKKMPEHDVVSWSAMIVGYVKSGNGLKAVELFQKMQQEGVEPDAVTFVGVLNACASVQALEEGMHVHEQIIRRGWESDIYVANSLVDMYAKCGSVQDAWTIFNKMQEHDVITWNSLIGGYVKSGQGLKAMELFREMQQDGMEPDAVTFAAVLSACASIPALEDGRHVHEQISGSGWVSDVYVANCLINMYSKCGSIEDASIVFKKMQDRDVITWNAMIMGYVKAGQWLQAIKLFWEMQQDGVEPDTITFTAVLNACTHVAALEEGRRVHSRISEVGCESDVYVATCLVDMYAKCGSVEDAWDVFNKMSKHDVISWSTMIVGYVKSGQGLKAMNLFHKMQQEGVEPDAMTFVGVLNACASVAALEEGKRVHEQIVQRGCESNIYVANCLVDMYAKCGSIEDAWNVFSNMCNHDVVTWNAMIGGYVKSGQGLKAMELFKELEQDGLEPDSITFIGMLNACAGVVALEEGRSIHEQIIRTGCESNVYVANCLVDMYAKCGSMEDAWSVFNKVQVHDVVTWNVMILGYAKSGQGLKAMELFGKMQQEGMEPDAVTFVGVLNACASVVALEEGRRIHAQAINIGCESDIYVATCLVDMYAKCGSIEDALNVFNKMSERDVVTWNAMILGYVKFGESLKAMELFREMQQEGLEPDPVTFVGVLSACASVAALEEGRCVHRQIIQRGWESNIHVANCLVDMYAKCGSVEDAWNVFSKVPNLDVVTWNAMIGGYAMHGQAEKALKLFARMSKEGAGMNGITFICLLSACSHGGLLKEGLRYFKAMSRCFNVPPTSEHYACMVDLLGRAGRLWEAEELLKKMPVETDVSLWMSLLGACRIHGNIEMGERAAKHCWELDPENASGYVLLSNLYTAAGN